jgi:internalin A
MLPSELEELIEQAAREEWEELDLSGCNLKKLPPTIAKLKKLKKLILGIKLGEHKFLHNQLTSLPTEISELTNLEILDLTSNKISHFPIEITSLTNLLSLKLGINQIKEIPEEISRLTNLQSLDLSHNQIASTWFTNILSSSLLLNPTKRIPEVITRLTSLQSLNLSGNGLSHIPDSISLLTSLQSLNLEGNQIKEIPTTISQLTSLKSINLGRNELKNLPEVIVQLTNLHSLELSSNNITKFPESIRKLRNLQTLDLSGNEMSEIAEEITLLKSLQELILSHNKITKIPKSISYLNNLKFLDLSDNSLSEIPEVITQLYNLQCLHLVKNRITDIPESIKYLKELRLLNLDCNYIKEIPEVILHLSNLCSLNLSCNQITMIPKMIIQNKSLYNLGLLEKQFLLSNYYRKYNENLITNPPTEIVEKGIGAIREYFHQIQEEGEDYLYEAKLLIVGEGGAGKTSLANKIINPSYRLCEEDSTKGIEVKKWKFSLANDKTFNVNIWDFGGQEIYHATHQYFLTKRSLYLLVADTRKEDTDFYYWLNVIELLSDNSPILIIKNEKQDRQRELSNQLRSEFENFKEAIPTNLANNRNLPAILTACEYHLSQLPHIGQTLPKTWVKVRHALENDPRNHISLNEYLQICKDNGFKERKNALQLSEYLHDLGICLHFQDDEMSPLYQTVILKPKWGTDAAYTVLDNPEVMRNFGRFSNKELAQIWSADKYSGMHSSLLELMKRFQLCYEIPQAKGNYIAPQLLTENQPKYAWDESENLILRYTYDFMPKGLVRQFIVAMHESIEAQNVWRSGVIIHKREYANTRAEVIENYGKREIKIRVSGKNKRDLLTVVTHELDKIHNSYKRLADKYQKLIPCNCSTCKGNQNPHFYEFANLKRRYANRKYTVECDISYESVDVLGLIDDVGERSNIQSKLGEEDRQYNRELNQPFPVNVNITNTFSPEQNMSSSQPNLTFNASVGQVNTGDLTVAGDNIGTQNNYSSNLSQAAKEIKELLDQLSEEYNPNTEKGQNSIKNEALKVIKNDSTLQQKIVNALKEGGVTALEEAINHPVAKIVIAATKGFLEG